MNMKTSERGIDFIKRWEKLALRAYDDGGGVWTIGYGHIHGVLPKDTCTPEQALTWLAEDVGWAEHCVNSNVRVAVTQNQFDAMVSLCFNIGIDAFANSTLLKKVNQSRFADAAAQFLRWKYDNGKVVGGLINRRTGERMMFLRPDEVPT